MVKQSYAILTDGRTIYFELENTPIENFTPTNNSIVLNRNLYTVPQLKSIVFGESYLDVTSIGDNFLYACSGLTSIDLSGLSNVTSIGGGFFADCSGLTSISLGDGSLNNLITTGFDNIKNVPTSTIIANTLKIAAEFKLAFPDNFSNWSVKKTPKPIIQKIFKSFDFKDNKIYNVRIDDPKIGENPVNKRTLIKTTTYDTDRAKKFGIPFKFPWLTEKLYGLRFKKVFDEILYPVIPYKYTNPKLDKIDFVSDVKNNAYNIVIDLGDSEPNGPRAKHQLFYNTNNFAFKLKFGINKHERPTAGSASLVIYDKANNIINSFDAINDNDSGIIEVTNQIFKPDYKIVFEKQYNASVVCDNTHNEPSPEDGFTNVGYKLVTDITAEFYNQFYLIQTPIIRLKTGTDGLATDVISGALNPPAGFIYNYTYQVNAGTECLFDILIPNGLDETIKPLQYNMEINIRLSPNTGNPYNKIIYTQKLGDLYNQLHMSNTIYTIGLLGFNYRLGYINLGIFETHPVRIDFILKPY